MPTWSFHREPAVAGAGEGLLQPSSSSRSVAVTWMMLPKVEVSHFPGRHEITSSGKMDGVDGGLKARL